MSADARRTGLSKMPEEEAREGRRRALFIAAVFLASVPVALVAPGVAPLLWLALFLDPVGRRVLTRRELTLVQPDLATNEADAPGRAHETAMPRSVLVPRQR